MYLQVWIYVHVLQLKNDATYLLKAFGLSDHFGLCLWIYGIQFQGIHKFEYCF